MNKSAQEGKRATYQEMFSTLVRLLKYLSLIHIWMCIRDRAGDVALLLCWAALFFAVGRTLFVRKEV